MKSRHEDCNVIMSYSYSEETLDTSDCHDMEMRSIPCDSEFVIVVGPEDFLAIYGISSRLFSCPSIYRRNYVSGEVTPLHWVAFTYDTFFQYRGSPDPPEKGGSAGGEV